MRGRIRTTQGHEVIGLGKTNHPYGSRKWSIVLSALAILIILAGSATFVVRHRHKTQSVKVQSVHLPADVDSVVKVFRYHHSEKEREITLTAAQVVRRGKKFLGMRSTLLKQTYLKDVTGTLKWKNSTIAFTAGRAEWSLDFDNPLILEEKVGLSLQGVELSGLSLAIIDCRRGIIETKGKEKRTYRID